MKLGVFSAIYRDLPIDQTLAKLSELGVDTVEVGCGGYSATAHASAIELLDNPERLAVFRTAIERSGIMISALSCHGNPVHPQAELADRYHREFEAAVLLAEQLGVDQVITFSGCPGDGRGGQAPNWVTYPWPEDFSAVLDYQWHDVVLPYWQRSAGFARERGIRIAIEMHPGFCVYNPQTLIRLREVTGDAICTNFDPSHLFWQGIDPVAAIRVLGSSISHVHAKDTWIDAGNIREQGVLDFSQTFNESRPWTFRTVGQGHGIAVWQAMVDALKQTGFDGAISIEHEDSRLSVDDGLKQAADFLRPLLV